MRLTLSFHHNEQLQRHFQQRRLISTTILVHLSNKAFSMQVHLSWKRFGEQEHVIREIEFEFLF